MKDLDYGKYIDRYLDGVMAPDEKKWFELELEGNQELQSDLQLFGKINLTLADKETLELSEQLNAIHEELYEDKKVYKINVKSIASTLSIAAVLVLGLILIKNQFYSSDYLVEKYYQPLDANLNYRSATSEVSDELKQAMHYYENKDYELAIVHFESILEKDQSKIGVNLYSGISHMEVHNYKEANIRFNKVIDHKENAFYESAQWYLGLSYLMTDEEEKASVVLSSLAEKPGFYQTEAKKILRRINH
jgi:hypothetical protein